MTNLFRRIDDTLIDGVFQPAVARLPGGDPHHWASLCYAGIAGTALARAVMDHANGVLLEKVWGHGLSIGLALVLYGMSLRQRTASRGANVHRINPISFFMRMAFFWGFVGIALAILATWGLGASVPLPRWVSLGNAILWVCAVYLDACNASPPQWRRAPAKADVAPARA